jgi:hypothetical protein
MDEIKLKIQEHISRELKFPDSTNLQQRGIADKIEDSCNEIIKRNFDSVIPAASRRSIEDINIGNTYVDHKTSDQALAFKMPNMISIDRLKKLDRPLLYNFVIYDSVKKEIINNFTLDVYELNWDYLKIQNLGKGQLQITSMNNFIADPIYKFDKNQWLDQLKLRAIEFYKKVEKDAKKRQKEWQQLIW